MKTAYTDLLPDWLFCENEADQTPQSNTAANFDADDALNGQGFSTLVPAPVESKRTLKTLFINDIAIIDALENDMIVMFENLYQTLEMLQTEGFQLYSAMTNETGCHEIVPYSLDPAQTRRTQEILHSHRIVTEQEAFELLGSQKNISRDKLVICDFEKMRELHTVFGEGEYIIPADRILSFAASVPHEYMLPEINHDDLSAADENELVSYKSHRTFRYRIDGPSSKRVARLAAQHTGVSSGKLRHITTSLSSAEFTVETLHQLEENPGAIPYPNLQQCKISGESKADIEPINLSGFPKLTHVSLSYTNITLTANSLPDTIHSFSAERSVLLLEGNPSYPSIRSCRLWSIRQTSEMLIAMPNLTKVDLVLDGNQSEEGLTDWVASKPENIKKITSATIWANTENAASLENFIYHAKNLSELDISAQRNIGRMANEPEEALRLDALRTFSLEVPLNFEPNEINIDHILEAASNLNHLHVAENNTCSTRFMVGENIRLLHLETLSLALVKIRAKDLARLICNGKNLHTLTLVNIIIIDYDEGCFASFFDGHSLDKLLKLRISCFRENQTGIRELVETILNKAVNLNDLTLGSDEALPSTFNQGMTFNQLERVRVCSSNHEIGQQLVFRAPNIRGIILDAPKKNLPYPLLGTQNDQTITKLQVTAHSTRELETLCEKFAYKNIRHLDIDICYDARWEVVNITGDLPRINKAIMSLSANVVLRFFSATAENNDMCMVVAVAYVGRKEPANNSNQLKRWISRPTQIIFPNTNGKEKLIKGMLFSAMLFKLKEIKSISVESGVSLQTRRGLYDVAFEHVGLKQNPNRAQILASLAEQAELSPSYRPPTNNIGLGSGSSSNHNKKSGYLYDSLQLTSSHVDFSNSDAPHYTQQPIAKKINPRAADYFALRGGANTLKLDRLESHASIQKIMCHPDDLLEFNIKGKKPADYCRGYVIMS